MEAIIFIALVLLATTAFILIMAELAFRRERAEAARRGITVYRFGVPEHVLEEADRIRQEEDAEEEGTHD